MEILTLVIKILRWIDLVILGLNDRLLGGDKVIWTLISLTFQEQIEMIRVQDNEDL